LKEQVPLSGSEYVGTGTPDMSLKEFIRNAWHVIEPGRTFVDGWHIGAIVEHLEAVSTGEISRLLINMPPRHMKSLSVSVCWPAGSGPSTRGYNFSSAPIQPCFQLVTI